MEKDPLRLFGITKSQLAVGEAVQAQFAEALSKMALEKGAEFYSRLNNVLRFCVAQEFNEKKSLEMLLNWVKWYEGFRPDKITLAEIKGVYDLGKARVAGTDRDGCPVYWIRMRYGVKGAGSGEEYFRTAIYLLERAVEEAEKQGHYQITVIHDRMGDYEDESESKEAMKKFTPTLQDNYPERLHMYYVIGVNIVFRGLFKVLSLVMSKKTTDKVRLLAGPAQLLEFIDEHNLLLDYGGKLRIPDCDRFIPLTEEQVSQKDIELMNEELRAKK